MVVRHYLGITHAEFFDFAVQAIFLDLNIISDLDTVFKKQNQTRGKIAENILQTKPQTDADYATENTQTAEIDAHRLQGNQNTQSNDDIVGQP